MGLEGTRKEDIAAPGDGQSSLSDPTRPTDGGPLPDAKSLKQETAYRRRAEEANAKFAAIVENSTDAIIGQKLDGTIVTWNHGAERIFGYTADEACGQAISLVFPAESIEEQGRIVQSIRRGEIVPPFET